MKSFLASCNSLLRSVVALGLCATLIGATSTPIYAATLTVTSTADNTTDDAFCTLREAILAANAAPANANCGAGAAGLDTIAFNLGAGTPSITLATPLPDITAPVIINGATGGATRIEILAGAANGSGLVLALGSSGSTLTALVLSGFSFGGSDAAIVIISANNRVENCLIGTDNTGLAAAAIGNSIGILIQSVNATGNVIGGNTVAQRNIISGNLVGINLTNDSSSNRIEGNYIGTDLHAANALPNMFAGVYIENHSTNNVVGGNNASVRNIISGNGVGIYINHADGNRIVGNYIGTDVAGISAIPNAFGGIGAGIAIEDAYDTIVGGHTVGERNLISGNDFGIVITNFSEDNVVIGNYIGTNAAGDAAIPNANSNNKGAGVLIEESDNNTIGGKTASARNLISGNEYGVVIMTDATFNHVEGNYIGINAAGTAALPNVYSGVFIEDLATANVIGGDTAAARNIISGNDEEGVTITGGAYDNIVRFNYIGTNPSGTSAIPNQNEGVDIDENSTLCGCIDATGNLIADNLISGNGSSGIEIEDPSTTGNIIVRNKIGTNAAGTAGIPNNDGGIYFGSGAYGNFVGSASPSDANLIAFNVGAGIIVFDPGTENPFLGNSIHSNTGLGIDLEDDGVTANDAGDPDIGANTFQNFPVLAAVTAATCNAVHITATLDSVVADGPYRIEFFANTVADASNHGEGQIFLGSTSHVGDNTPFSVVLPAPALAAGARLAGTATSQGGNGSTSEFSLNLVMPAVGACGNGEAPKPPPPPPPVTQDLGLKGDTKATYTLRDNQTEFHIFATLGENSNGGNASATMHLFIPSAAQCQQIFVNGVEAPNACVSGIDDGRIELGTVTVTPTQPTDIRVLVNVVQPGAFTVLARIFSNFANIPNQMVLDPNPRDNELKLVVEPVNTTPPASGTVAVTLGAQNPAQMVTCVAGTGCRLNWVTSSELNLSAFSLVREVVSEPSGKPRANANARNIAPLGKNGAGATYSITDNDVLAGGVYRYTLNAIGINGDSQAVFSQRAAMPYAVYLSMLKTKGSPSQSRLGDKSAFAKPWQNRAKPSFSKAKP